MRFAVMSKQFMSRGGCLWSSPLDGCATSLSGHGPLARLLDRRLIYGGRGDSPPSTHPIIYDFRSDTVTTPTIEMRQAMQSCTDVGDDVFAEDNTVCSLERTMAQLAGKEGGLFCPSGTMANQIALLATLRSPPHSVLVDASSHMYCWEAGGASFLSGTTLIPVTPASKHLSLHDVQTSIWLGEDDVHVAPTKMIAVENTLNGEVMPITVMNDIYTYATSHGIHVHLDGARILNACVASNLSLDVYGASVDSMSVCLSKGIGAPVGSVLLGSGAFIRKCRHLRKMLGGGWRQAGVLAAPALVGLKEWQSKLARDHEAALVLSQGLIALGFRMTKQVHTNMVWVDLGGKASCDVWANLMLRHGIRVQGGPGSTMRIVIHHQNRDAVSLLLTILHDNIASLR